jgi:hypothetical protein
MVNDESFAGAENNIGQVVGVSARETLARYVVLVYDEV